MCAVSPLLVSSCCLLLSVKQTRLLEKDGFARRSPSLSEMPTINLVALDTRSQARFSVPMGVRKVNALQISSLGEHDKFRSNAPFASHTGGTRQNRRTTGIWRMAADHQSFNIGSVLLTSSLGP